MACCGGAASTASRCRSKMRSIWRPAAGDQSVRRENDAIGLRDCWSGCRTAAALSAKGFTCAPASARWSPARPPAKSSCSRHCGSAFGDGTITDSPTRADDAAARPYFPIGSRARRSPSAEASDFSTDRIRDVLVSIGLRSSPTGWRKKRTGTGSVARRAAAAPPRACAVACSEISVPRRGHACWMSRPGGALRCCWKGCRRPPSSGSAIAPRLKPSTSAKSRWSATATASAVSEAGAGAKSG